MNIQFNKNGYLKLLMFIIKNNYNFIKMIDYKKPNKKRIILRHDVDFSIDYAIEMAEIEEKIGVISNYFFMVTSHFYNVFSEPNRKKLRQISEMGHQIGLHFDTNFLPANMKNIDIFFNSQLLLLSDIIEQQILISSQHIPTDSKYINFENYVSVDSYSQKINKTYDYVSDSSMTWRSITPADLVENDRDFQFLAHPIWWIAKGKTQDEKISGLLKSINRNYKGEAELYLSYMKKVLMNRKEYDLKFQRNRK